MDLSALRDRYGPVVKWLIVGGATAVVDVVAFALVNGAGAPIPVANAISTAVGMIFNYLVHRAWTFRDSSSSTASTAWRYVVQYALTWALTTALIYLLVLVVPAWLAKALSIALTAPIGYLLLRFWVFRHSGPDSRT